MNKTATIFDIQRGSFSDGPGIRTTVFFKGCNLRCAWCHNPESQEKRTQMLFYRERCVGCGRCIEECPNHLESCDFCGKCEIVCEKEARKICGKSYTVDEILNECMKDQMFYEPSGGGVTFSGGECMLYIDFLEELIRKCKENGLHTAIDTAGCVPYSYFERILPYTDLFLYDIKCFDSKKHQMYTGVGNELIFENLKHLLKAGANVIVRIPVISGVNDSVEEMKQIKELLDSYGKVQGVELLPYHKMGEVKYEALSLDMQKWETPSKDKLRELKHVFKEEDR